MTELERIDQAAEYFRRYEQKESAITQNRENQEYLKTYIHDEEYVVKNFNIKAKIAKGIGVSAGAAVAVFIVFFLTLNAIADFPLAFVISLILALFAVVGGSVFAVSLQHFRFTEAKKRQVEVNEGITEQIEMLRSREPQLIQDKENFYKGLEERVTFISPEDRKYIGEIRRMVESGEAETAEDAAAVLEQKILLQQFNDIMEKSEIKVYTDEENKERFGDPLELIKKKRKPFFKKKKK